MTYEKKIIEPINNISDCNKLIKQIESENYKADFLDYLIEKIYKTM